jgi:nucleoside-diphosphate-sugar epimerase
MDKRKKIIILGGLGFIGKNLYKSLIGDHHDVTILTNRIPEEDDGFLDPDTRKNVIVGSILDKEFITNTLPGYDVIFSLAGSSGASDSIKNPYHDLDTNLKGHLNILEACRNNNPRALLIFPSSRLVYGKPETNPVSENHPIKPESIYAIHKLTTEYYYLLYKRLYNVNCVIFRVSNPFGPYQGFNSHHYGILNWFIHKAVGKEQIEIYGEGNQKRDFIYIDDLTDLFKLSMDHEKMWGQIYNVGYGQGIPLKEAVRLIAKYIPDTRVTYKPWPEIDQKIETGDYISDISLLKREIGWEPAISFEEGIKKTIEFYDKESK